MDEAKEKQMQKFMLKFAGDQASILTQRTFAAWKEFHQLVLDEIAEQKMKDKLIAGDAAKEAQMQRFMMKFAGDKAGVLKKGCFNAWKEDWIETMAQKRFDQQMEAKMAEMSKDKK